MNHSSFSLACVCYAVAEDSIGISVINCCKQKRCLYFANKSSFDWWYVHKKYVVKHFESWSDGIAELQPVIKSPFQVCFVKLLNFLGQLYIAHHSLHYLWVLSFSKQRYYFLNNDFDVKEQKPVFETKSLTMKAPIATQGGHFLGKTNVWYTMSMPTTGQCVSTRQKTLLLTTIMKHVLSSRQAICFG